MKNLYACTSAVMMLSACASQPPAPVAATPPAPPPLVSGIDRSGFDASVRPQDNFYEAVNGAWLKRTAIPADKSSYGTLTELSDNSEREQREIIEAAAADKQRLPDSDEQKIGDYYSAFLDVARVDQLGLQPLQAELARIAAIHSRAEIAQQFAHFAEIGVDAPFGMAVEQDAKDSTRYAVYLGQSGLGLPDRDYYLLDDPKFVELRKQYVAHISRMLALAGDSDADAHARKVFAFEKRLAEKQWSKVETRDADKTYNKYALSELPGLIPDFSWLTYATSAGFAQQPAVIVGEPGYFEGLSKILNTTSLSNLKIYLRWQLLNAYAPYLSKPFVDENFAFYGKALNGVPEDRPRWKRGVSAVNEALGFAVGKLYVARYFPPQNKARMQVLVNNLLEEYRLSIGSLAWMSADTKKKALEKLAKFTTKIGYPDQWRDYSTLRISADDLVGNVIRASRFEFARNAAKLGKPIDRNEWDMTPQTVNAYYNPLMNEIVFPAAILQAPVFDMQADDAANYGAIGAIIGHEIGHGFDDQGSKYDGDGNLKSWWTDADRRNFDTRVKALITQYSAYEPIKGYHVNGALTIGENIGDLGGVSISYLAYQLSLAGKPALVIDGLTGDQRFFMGWAQAWRWKYRDEAMINLVKTNPHSPPQFRCNGVVVNVPAFYGAFDVKPGDGMYRAPQQRVTIW
ncbi:MAG: M13 family metallopeptidase [Stenotrophobium sp.]